MVILKARVQGMSCAHCEAKVEKAAAELPGVRGAKANAAKGAVELALDDGMEAAAVREGLGAALTRLGYELLPERASVSKDDALALGAGVVLAGAFAGLEAIGAFGGLPRLGGQASLWMLFATGLATSLHCVSMCGGIALSQGLRAGTAAIGGADGRSPRVSAAAIRPSLLYNLGRVASYTAIGAVAGATGSALKFGPGLQAGIMAAAAVFMLGMGLSLAGLVRLPRLRWKAYEALRGKAAAAAAKVGPFAVGLANGLMPCGPLQAMQAFALGSGSAAAGALSMAAFSLGTVPLLFLFGAGGSLIKPRFRGMAVKAGGVLVLFLGALTMSRAWALTPRRNIVELTPASTRIAAPQAKPAAIPGGSAAQAIPVSRPASAGIRAEPRGGFQEAVVPVGARSYGDVIAKAGVPLRINLRVEPGRLNGCNEAIVIPSLGVRQALNYGDNWIEILPERPGVIPYSCWMGMIRARIVVEP